MRIADAARLRCLFDADSAETPAKPARAVPLPSPNPTPCPHGSEVLAAFLVPLATHQKASLARKITVWLYPPDSTATQTRPPPDTCRRSRVLGSGACSIPRLPWTNPNRKGGSLRDDIVATRLAERVLNPAAGPLHCPEDVLRRHPAAVAGPQLATRFPTHRIHLLPLRTCWRDRNTTTVHDSSIRAVHLPNGRPNARPFNRSKCIICNYCTVRG